MLAPIRAWLNSSRSYFNGVAILSEIGCDNALLQVLQKGPNDFRVRRLQQEMLQAYELLKDGNNSQKNKYLPDKNNNATSDSNCINPFSADSYDNRINQNIQKNEQANKAVGGNQQPAPQPTPINEELYLSCKKEADLLYKKVMNDRAVLFALANEDDFLDPNMPDKVSKREKLAIAVVTGWQKVSELYDRASYVKENGRLPNTEENIISEYDSLPDELVKQQLDNSRKAFNKLKKKEATPERVALMQKHQTNIQKLEAKWRSLQAVN